MRVLVLRLAAVLVLATALAGCGAPAALPGVPQQQYDALSAQLTAAQGRVAELQVQVDRLNQDAQVSVADKTKLQGQVTGFQAQVSQLQNDVSKLKQDSQLAGSTPAEIARMPTDTSDTPAWSSTRRMAAACENGSPW